MTPAKPPLPLMAQIRDAISQRDARSLERAAHTLKGAAAAVADAARRLEIMGRTGELTGAKSVCTELEDALHRLKPKLLAISSYG
jgi:two-component system, sensor histidine kinase and response regulator